MANYNNNNNWEAFKFLSFFIAKLKTNHISTFDVTKFIDVVMRLKNAPELESILNEFSNNFEQCQSQMIELCGTLNEGKYIDGETMYVLHFLNKNFDSTMEDLPKTIDKNLLNQFFHFMKVLQEKTHQDIISESDLLQFVMHCQKDKNFSDNDIKKQREGIQQYLSVLSSFGFLTMPSIYSVSIPDEQLNIILKNCQREEYKKIMKQMDLFLEYYKHPEKLESIPVFSEQIQTGFESTSNITNQKEGNLIVKEAIPKIQTQNSIEAPTTLSVTEKDPSVVVSLNKPLDYMPISSRPVVPNSHFKSVKGVLLSFLSLLQTKGIYQFDSAFFEDAMNEIMKDSSFYYAFPSNFPEFAEKYIGILLKGKEKIMGDENNPYTIFDIWAREHYVKREGEFCFKLRFSNNMIEYSLNHLTDEDLQKIEYLTEQYLVAFRYSFVTSTRKG